MSNHLGALPSGDRWRAIEVHVDNDANLGALAELKRGAGRGYQNIFYVRVDDGGIGAGLIFNGRSYRGAGGIAGEFGHVVLEPDKHVECRLCGRPCVEAVIGSMLGCRDGACDPPLADLLQAAVEGDTDAIDSIKAAADYLGRALASFVTVLNVDRILIGGPFPPQAYTFVIPPIQVALDRLTITPVARDYVSRTRRPPRRCRPRRCRLARIGTDTRRLSAPPCGAWRAALSHRWELNGQCGTRSAAEKTSRAGREGPGVILGERPAGPGFPAVIRPSDYD